MSGKLTSPFEWTGGDDADENDTFPAVPERSEVKRVFCLMLEAAEHGDAVSAGELAAVVEEARAAFETAAPAVRAAVQKLLDAHQRASGVLLEPSADAAASFEDQVRSGTDEAAPALPPLSIPKLKIGEEIGRGGFGVVYRAEQLHPVQRPVAVKVLRTEFITANLIARFRAEARVLAKMNHPGIARILDAGLDACNRPYVVMELVEGEPLLSYCDRNRLPVRDRVRLMVEVCEAVHHAHQRAVIHRDLKPANILVERIDGRPRPRVIDFGIAKIVEEDADELRTHEGMRLGTPRYMSPEQATGTDIADVRSDVYALGVMLCEVLTNQVPRDPAGTESKSGSKPKTRATRPSTLAATGEPAVARRSSELRGDLDRIVLKAVALEPDERYESAAALAEDLQRYLDGMPVKATPPGWLYLTRKFVARHTIVSVAAALSLISLGGGAIAATYGLAQANRNRLAAEQALVEVERERNRAEAVAEFLLGDMLDAMNPDLTGNGEPEMRALLRNSVREAEKRLAVDGELLVDVLMRIGRAMRTLTDFEAAADTLERAAAVSIEIAGPLDRRSLDLRIDALVAALSARRFEGAVEAIAAIRADAEAAFGPSDPITLRARLHEAHITPQDFVAQSMREVLDALETGGHVETALHLEALRYVGSAMYHERDPDAIAFLARAAESVERRYGPTHSLAIELRLMTASAAALAGEVEMARNLLIEVAETSERLHGPANWYRFSAVGRLAQLDLQAENLSDALAMARLHLDIARMRGGTDSEMHARTGLSEVLIALNQHDQVQEVLAPVFDQAQPGQVTRTNAAMLLANAFVHLQDLPTARTLIEHERDLLPERHPHRGYLDSWLAEHRE